MSDPTLAAVVTELDAFEVAHGPVNITLDDIAKTNPRPITLRGFLADRVVASARKMLADAQQGRGSLAKAILCVQQAMRRLSAK